MHLRIGPAGSVAVGIGNNSYFRHKRGVICIKNMKHGLFMTSGTKCRRRALFWYFLGKCRDFRRFFFQGLCRSKQELSATVISKFTPSRRRLHAFTIISPRVLFTLRSSNISVHPNFFDNARSPILQSIHSQNPGENQQCYRRRN